MEKERRKRREAPAPDIWGYTWIFTFLSFFGWCFEKFGRYLIYPGDPVRDRGFLTLPFCTIYGTSVVIIGFLLGAPNAPSRFLRGFWKKSEGWPLALRVLARLLVYFAAAMVLATAVELVTGLPFHLAGMPLWNYSERWGNLFGVICPSYSLLWGGLITVLMGVIWWPLCVLVEKVPKRVRKPVAILMIAVLLGDFLFNCGYVLVTGHRFYFL
jgi:uncharacterized membrane protein